MDCDMIWNRDFKMVEFHFIGKGEGYHCHRTRRIATGWRRLFLIRSIMSKGRLLDIGCGFGYLIEAAQHFGYIAEGLDIAKFAVDFCQKKGFRVLQGNATHLPYPDEYFSVVTLINSLEHVGNLNQCLSEISRVLVNGGCIMIVGPNAEYWKALHRPSYDWWETENHCVTFTYRFLSNIFNKHNLKIVSLPVYSMFRNFLSALRIDKNVTVFARRINRS